MKKLLVLLLIATLAAFVFVGCDLIPSEGEGEGEGEGEPEGIVVEIDGQYEEAGRIYVPGGDNDVTVTFPAPVTGMVQISTTDCTGNYSKAGTIALFPNADKTIWTGSVFFECGYTSLPSPCDTACTPVDKPCCATTITVISGACETDECIVFPVIVDCDAPTAELCVASKCCVCEGYELSFMSTTDVGTCAPDEENCYDDCSGIAGWSLDIYCGNPFKDCCEIPCDVPIFTDSGTSCPIEVTTSCIECGDPDESEFFAIFSIWDNVGNIREEGAFITVNESCEIVGVAPYTLTSPTDSAGKPCIDPWDLDTCEVCPVCP